MNWPKKINAWYSSQVKSSTKFAVEYDQWRDGKKIPSTLSGNTFSILKFIGIVVLVFPVNILEFELTMKSQ